MSGVMREFDVSLIGHLETFKMDWKRIEKAYKIKDYNYLDRLGSHVTSANHPVKPAKDPNQARMSFRVAMKEDPRYARAICHLIMLDYICLPEYNLPQECQYLNATRSLGETILLG